MSDRFTGRARRVIVFAQEEARMLNHRYIGTDHILLGLIREGEGVGAKSLEGLGVSLDAVRDQVQEIIGQGQQAPYGHIPFTPRAKKVLELSLREALQLGHTYIGTEHLLLGVIREGEGVAARVLVELGADLNRVRQQVVQQLSGSQGTEHQGTGVGAAGDPVSRARAADRPSGRPPVRGPDHPDPLGVREALARWQWKSGDLASAAAVYTKLLTDQQQALGPDHRDTLATRGNLANLHGLTGDPAGAVTAFADLSIDQLRVLGPDHGDTLATRANLTFWQGKAGDPTGAE